MAFALMYRQAPPYDDGSSEVQLPTIRRWLVVIERQNPVKALTTFERAA
jgi:hypothetical protein